jgi:hypothetical protein
MRWLTTLALIVVATRFGAPQEAGVPGWTWHTPPERWQGPRSYHTPFDPDFAGRVRLDRVRDPVSPPGRELSPNGAYWFAVVEDDRTRPGPWDARVLVFVEREELLRLSLVDCRGVQARWVNEKLLYVEVWWGRVLGTRLILDVEQGAVLYREMVNDGAIPYQQWREAAAAGAPP